MQSVGPPRSYQQAVRRRLLSVALALLALGLMAPSALASFHLVKVTEVFPGTAASPQAEFVELRMPAAGENFFANHKLTLYGPTSAMTGSCAFTATLPNGENQRSALIATPAAVTAFGVATDCALAAGDHLNPSAGAACWDVVDCVAWGSVTNTASLASPTGSPAPAIADGMSLNRSTAGACATQLEVGDDTDDSAADFALAAPTPLDNASPAAGTPCSPGGGGADTSPPKTQITKAPHKKISKGKVKIKFRSSEQGSSFKCKLDKGSFKSCDSPFRAKVDLGKHKFKVFAIDPAGNRDATPAKLKFKRVKG